MRGKPTIIRMKILGFRSSTPEKNPRQVTVRSFFKQIYVGMSMDGTETNPL